MVKKDYKKIIRLFLTDIPREIQGLEVKSHDFHIPILRWVGNEIVVLSEPYKIPDLTIYFYTQREDSELTILEKREAKIVRIQEIGSTSF